MCERGAVLPQKRRNSSATTTWRRGSSLPAGGNSLFDIQHGKKNRTVRFPDTGLMPDLEMESAALEEVIKLYDL
jgi:hypothetical protein